MSDMELPGPSAASGMGETGHARRPGGSGIPAIYSGYYKGLEKLKSDIRKKAQHEKEAAEKTTKTVHGKKSGNKGNDTKTPKITLSCKIVKKVFQRAQGKPKDEPVKKQHVPKAVEKSITGASPDDDPNDWLEEKQQRQFRRGLLSRKNETPAQPCHFLRLPLEIREQIYGYLLEAPGPIRVLEGWSKVHRHKRQSLETGIMRTNSQIADECVRVLYGRNTFEYLIRDSTGLRPSSSGRSDAGNGRQGRENDTGVDDVPDESDMDDDDSEYEDDDDGHSDHEGDEYEFPSRRRRHRGRRHQSQATTRNAAKTTNVTNKRSNRKPGKKITGYSDDNNSSPTSSSRSSSRAASKESVYNTFNPDVEINVAKFGHHFRHIRIKAETGRSGPHYRARMAAAIAAFSNLRPRRAKLRTIGIEITPTRHDHLGLYQQQLLQDLEDQDANEKDNNKHDLTFLDFFDPQSDVVRALRVLPCQFIRVVVNTHAGPKDIVVDRRHAASLRRGERDIWAGDVVVQAQRKRAESARRMLEQLPQTIRKVWLENEVQESGDIWGISDLDDEIWG